MCELACPLRDSFIRRVGSRCASPGWLLGGSVAVCGRRPSSRRWPVHNWYSAPPLSYGTASVSAELLAPIAFGSPGGKIPRRALVQVLGTVAPSGIIGK